MLTCTSHASTTTISTSPANSVDMWQQRYRQSPTPFSSKDKRPKPHTLAEYAQALSTDGRTSATASWLRLISIFTPWGQHSPHSYRLSHGCTTGMASVDTQRTLNACLHQRVSLLPRLRTTTGGSVPTSAYCSTMLTNSTLPVKTMASTLTTTCHNRSLCKA